jgi:hypothetical protein
MAYNQQLSVLSQVAPATTGTAGQVLVSAGSSASSYWASAIPVSAYSAQFNGSSSYLSLASSTTFNFGTGDATVEFWFNSPGTSSNYPGIISAVDYNLAGAGGIRFDNLAAKGKIFMYINGGGDPVIASTSTIAYNTWAHIAIVRQSTSLKLYLNGALDTSVTISGSLNWNLANGGTRIGRGFDVDSTNGYYPGYLSNLRVVKGVAVYTGNFTVPTSPLGTAQGSGTNIAAVTASQTSLLTCNGPGFTDSSPNAFTITNNGTVIASQFAPFSSFSAIARSATQTQTILTSGSGTYYTPSGVAWLRIRMVGGGGGGNCGTGGGAGTAGTNTTFGSSFLVAGGGNIPVIGYGGVGGTASIGAGATGITLAGGQGSATAYALYPPGGIGGSSVFGGGGSGGYPDGGTPWPGKAGVTNTGGGGGGGNVQSGSNISGGAGGGAGGYVEAYISSPAASYAYTVGAGGAGGAGSGTVANGGGGGSGIIIVEENYAVSVVKKSMTQTILTSGSGTYTTPIGVVQLEIRMVGGGGGAGGGSVSSAYAGAGSAGTSTTFGTSFLTATAGSGADNSNAPGLGGGAGGTGTITGATGITIAGGRGSPGGFSPYSVGGLGGSTPFGGVGVGFAPGSVGNGTAGSTNSGSGGGAGGGPGAGYSFAGHGGGGGGYIEAYISSPAASYAYTVGTGGGGGAGSTGGNGGSGGTGIIIIKEYY